MSDVSYEQGSQDQRHRTQQFDQHVQRRPAVSLNGSPTVSPTTAALWGAPPLPPYWPVSMNFLALSQAPPPLFSMVATRIPPIVPTIRKAATASAPTWKSLKKSPTAIGIPTARSPGATISLSAPTVTMSTARP